MKFLRRNNSNLGKLILVISDLHLGAGHMVNGKKNLLEDFHYDEELIEFLNFYSTKEFASTPVELIINGDFFDLLAVPYVEFFDDEFWSESAALEKLKIICDAHTEVIEALDQFLNAKNKSIVYIIGNHDAELVFESLKTHFFCLFSEDNQSKITLSNEVETYKPCDGVYIQHGHEYEAAHNFDKDEVVIKSAKGENYFIPPWGSYYVMNVINKYKTERDNINCVRPIKNFLIHGLIFDTLFILRFMMANVYYFFMVRILQLYQQSSSISKVFKSVLGELHLFQDFEELTLEFFKANEDADVLIVGHTHKPTYHEFSDGKVFINTGTWTRMIGLDLNFDSFGTSLTFAQIKLDQNLVRKETALLTWKGYNHAPYEDYRGTISL